MSAKENKGTLSILDLIGEELSHEEILQFQFDRYAGRTIKARRDELGLSQEELAVKSKVARSTISSVERFNRSLSMEAFLKLMDALGMKVVLEKKNL